MILLETVAVAFAMFSALPLPRVNWNQQNMRYPLCAFPLVGVVCGLGWWGVAALAGWLKLPVLLQAAGFCLLPVAVTGGIHLDGYADTCDALASCAAPEKKRQILQDPHCGAFAVIRLCSYFVAYLGLCAAFAPPPRALGCMGLAFVLERALSGYAVAAFPLAKNTGLAHTFATAADQKNVRRVLAVLAAVLAVALLAVGGLWGVAMLLAAAAALWRYKTVAAKQFGGLSGDLAGWFLQRAELWMLGALVACQLVEGVL
ncbi:MAG: adenosylcobinamide-GDP ribazoletransferase [Gemmiger sp.]|nr:adenosylcobinamide-GDP ribazoletransferase [Gemmiger sp.]